MKNILATLSLFFCLNLSAQDLNGYWYGTANVIGIENTSNYLVEMILKQNGTSIQGIMSYYFKDTYRSIKVSGRYNPSTRMVSMRDIPLPFHGSTARTEVDCPMDLSGQLRIARAGSDLDGMFIAKEKYKYLCPDIRFDFKLNKDAGNEDSILYAIRQFKEVFQVWRPDERDSFVRATVIQRPIINYVVSSQFKERQKEMTKEFLVESDSLHITFYDNGEVDGDSISIFFNDQLLASSQHLSTKAINLSVALDPLRPFNEISMFADNLGRIPPNTALMFVYDGSKRYEVRLASSLEKSATVRFRKKATGGSQVNHQ
jgi:hypothetical protein